MRKSPEEYFKAQDFSTQVPGEEEFTPAERAFMAKYMGMDCANVLEQLGLPPAAVSGRVEAAIQMEPDTTGNAVETTPQPEEQGAVAVSGSGENTVARVEPEIGPDAGQPVEASETETDSEKREVTDSSELTAVEDTGIIAREPQTEPEASPPVMESASMQDVETTAESSKKSNEPSLAQDIFGTRDEHSPEEEYLEEALKKEQEIQMVGFFIGGQEFTIPTAAVQEVIRYMPVAKLPAAPSFIAGVINLRGRVTPLVELRDILEVRSPREGENRFIIVCRRQGLQIGMLIEKVHTMYRVPQADIEWGIEAHLGINGECVAGLFKQNEQLVSIVSVDRVIADVLK